MASGSLLTMPLLIINMGAEMIYVLDQRLKAQNIPRDKSAKVLEDIIKTMHNEKFMVELFKPHLMYSNVATRQIFDRLAHSSIMRLNTNSMDKLYDLMRMGFKYQMLSCKSADELLQVTMNHLINIKTLIDAEEVQKLLDETILLSSQTFGGMSAANFYLLKQFLCRFYQDTRVKVSLFLQNGIQGMDGTLSIRADGLTAAGGKVPGIIRYFDEVTGNPDEEEKFQIGSATNAVEAPAREASEFGAWKCSLGHNMYEAEGKEALNKSKELIAKQLVGAKKLPIGGVAADAKKRHTVKTFKTTANDGLNLLSDLLGTAGADAKSHFRFNLFPDDLDKHQDDKGVEENAVPTIVIDATSQRKTASAMLQDLKLDDGDVKQSKDGDDLLNLMDSAT